jgi:ERCC4-type nuclease
MMNRRVIADTREQRVYALTLPSGSEVIRQKLDSGDYSLEGLEEIISIERKSLDDWIGTILNSKSRFRNELTRLQNMCWAAVVIEGSISDILSGNYVSKVKPDALLGMSCQLMLQYSPVHFVYANDRPHAARLVSELLILADKNIPLEITESAECAQIGA